MELLFVVIIAAGVGFILTFALRGRETYGVLLPAAVGSAVASVVWVALLWMGLRFDGTWIWVASLVAGGLASLAVALRLPPRRRQVDRAMLDRLSGRKA
jgi:hypothetical protein